MVKHYIINSTNEIEEYIEFVPSCYQMWKKYLDCIYVLAFITDRDKSDPLVKRVSEFCDELYLFKPIDGIHTGIQAKTIRMWLATQFGEDVCTLTDIDQYLFDYKWLMECIKPAFEDHKFVAIGHDVYYGTKDEGKFPMYYTSGSSSLFKRIINHEEIDNFVNWFNRFREIKDPIDNKETIGPVFSDFSDESLLRYLIVNHPDQDFIKECIVKKNREKCEKYKCFDRLDRSVPYKIEHKESFEKLVGVYKLKDCNPLRPFNKYFIENKGILDYFGLDLDEKSIML